MLAAQAPAMAVPAAAAHVVAHLVIEVVRPALPSAHTGRHGPARRRRIGRVRSGEPIGRAAGQAPRLGRRVVDRRGARGTGGSSRHRAGAGCRSGSAGGFGRTARGDAGRGGAGGGRPRRWCSPVTLRSAEPASGSARPARRRTRRDRAAGMRSRGQAHRRRGGPSRQDAQRRPRGGPSPGTSDRPGTREARQYASWCASARGAAGVPRSDDAGDRGPSTCRRDRPRRRRRGRPGHRRRSGALGRSSPGSYPRDAEGVCGAGAPRPRGDPVCHVRASAGDPARGTRGSRACC